MDFTPGDIVKVRQGKYAGKIFVVISTEGEKRAYIANGTDYRCDNPKKKNILHLQKTQINLEDVADLIAGGKTPDNGWLNQQISAINEIGNKSCRQGG